MKRIRLLGTVALVAFIAGIIGGLVTRAPDLGIGDGDGVRTWAPVAAAIASAVAATAAWANVGITTARERREHRAKRPKLECVDNQVSYISREGYEGVTFKFENRGERTAEAAGGYVMEAELVSGPGSLLPVRVAMFEVAARITPTEVWAVNVKQAIRVREWPAYAIMLVWVWEDRVSRSGEVGWRVFEAERVEFFMGQDRMYQWSIDDTSIVNAERMQSDVCKAIPGLLDVRTFRELTTLVERYVEQSTGLVQDNSDQPLDRGSVVRS
jgi:hypothetical protein